MKRLVEKGLMFGNLIEVSSPAVILRNSRASHGAVEFRTTPLPRPLPTRGRGGYRPVRVCSVSARLAPPSPLWGGLGRGAGEPRNTP